MNLTWQIGERRGISGHDIELTSCELEIGHDARECPRIKRFIYFCNAFRYFRRREGTLIDIKVLSVTGRSTITRSRFRNQSLDQYSRRAIGSLRVSNAVCNKVSHSAYATISPSDHFVTLLSAATSSIRYRSIMGTKDLTPKMFEKLALTSGAAVVCKCIDDFPLSSARVSHQLAREKSVTRAHLPIIFETVILTPVLIIA